MARRRPSAETRTGAGATPPPAHAPRLPDAPGLVIVVDTREQLPLDFTGVCPFVVAGLRTGDYSLLGHEHEFCIERKSVADLHGSIISDRPRFTREIERMATYDFAAILVEGTVADVLGFALPPRAATHFTPAQLAAHPKTIVNSLLSWQVEHGIHVHFAGADRNVCRALVLSLAKRYWRKRHPLTAREVLGGGPAPPAPAA